MHLISVVLNHTLQLSTPVYILKFLTTFVNPHGLAERTISYKTTTLFMSWHTQPTTFYYFFDSWLTTGELVPLLFFLKYTPEKKMKKIKTEKKKPQFYASLRLGMDVYGRWDANGESVL